MFVNKHLFDDVDGNSEPERLPPNQPDVPLMNNADDKRNKMKDILAEQRALALKKKEARTAAMAGSSNIKMTNDDRTIVGSTSNPPTRIVKKQSSSTVDDLNDDGKGRSSEGSSDSTDAIEPIFDPTASNDANAMEPDPSSSLSPGDIDFKDMNRFLNSPPAAQIQCYIVRQRSGLKNRLYPKYELYLKNGDQFILAAKKRTKNKSSNYLISKDTNDLNKDSSNFVGKLRSNFIGTEFTIYDNGMKPKDTSVPNPLMPPKPSRKELGCVFYQSNILGSRGPRKMTVLLPAEESVNSSKGGLLDIFKSGEHLISKEITCLENKPPKWSDQVGAYVLNFNGRVTMASVKNFQLIQTGCHTTPQANGSAQDGVVIMQFGRVAKDNFTMDFRAPLTPLQAFAIALSSFDYKIACE